LGPAVLFVCGKKIIFGEETCPYSSFYFVALVEDIKVL
jgi:hypothetical protein